MANEKDSIYLVNFEDYLKPKAESKPVQEPIPSPPPPPVEERSSFEMFCESTSIHGFCMLVLTKKASLCERLTWQIIIFNSVIFSALVLYKSMLINAGTPTVTHIESTHRPAFTVPFPAVTLCSLNRISKDRGFKLARKFSKSTNLPMSEILRLFETPFYSSQETHAIPEDYQKFDEILTMHNYTLVDYLMAVTPDCMKRILRCKWKGRTAPCDSLFDTLLAPRGRCCSFNNYARPVNRSVRNIQSLIPLVPRHVSASGPETGLTVLIDPRVEDYMGGFLKAPGYRIILHDAYDFPEDNSYNEFLPIRSENYIAVKTEVTYGTKYLRNMGFDRRGCTFDSEHRLKFFTEYSYWNCLEECLSSRVLDNCGCITHHMVRYPGRQMCNMTQHICINRETEIFQRLKENSSVLATEICGCMPECSYNHYRAIASGGRLNRTYTKGRYRFFRNITIKDQILLHVFYADLTMSLYRMDALDSWQSIVGTVGGITGITMGFSVVSISEAFFFLCVRPLYLKCVKLVTQVKANICAN